MKKQVRFLIFVGCVLTLCIGTSAAVPDHDADFYRGIHADSILLAAYNEDGCFLGCTVRRVSEFSGEEWTLTDAAEYREFAVTDEFVPVSKDAPAHVFAAPEYSWNGTACTATRICTLNPEHFETETVTAVPIDHADPGCEDGYDLYAATFENPAFSNQQLRVSLAAKHKPIWGFSDPTTAFNICDDCKTVLEKRQFPQYAGYTFQKFLALTDRQKWDIQNDLGDLYDLWVAYLNGTVQPVIIGGDPIDI